MPKTSQNILIFIDSVKPYTVKYHTPVKIAKSYMNRFTIDEDASFELIGVHDVPLHPFGGANGQFLLSKKVAEIEQNMPIRNIRESETHFMFAINDGFGLQSVEYLLRNMTDMFNSLLSKFHIKSAMVTVISMVRHDLITKEMMEAYPKGTESIHQSIHDDLDYFFEKFQFEKFKYNLEDRKEIIESYFLPKLTSEEKRLVESKNELFMGTLLEKNPNKILQKMKKSESKAMFLKGVCWRQTFQIDFSPAGAIPSLKIKL